MKQIINNVLYDSEKAIFLCSYYNGSLKRDLYRSRKIYKFFVINYDYWEEESKIEVKEEEFVKTVLGKINIDKYIELFGEPKEA